MAAAYALSNAVEHGLRTRATIVDMRGQLNIRQWEETASAAMGHVWVAESEGLFAHMVSPNTKQVDSTRLAIDLSALEQLIGDNRDDCDEEVDGPKGDYPRCIDTPVMLSNCLKKTMTSCQLTETLSTGIFDMRPTHLRRVSPSKPKHRNWRASKKGQERLQDPDTRNFSCL